MHIPWNSSFISMTTHRMMNFADSSKLRQRFGSLEPPRWHTCCYSA
jgi:hypothetical protein